MPVVKNINFYSFCLQSSSEVEDALLLLAQKKDSIIRESAGDGERLFAYVERALSAISSDRNTAGGGIIKFLDKNLIFDFMNRPQDGTAYSALAYSLILVSAGLGIMSEPMPYDYDDLLAMQDGNFKFYHDVPFAYTLNRVLEGGEEVADLAEVLLGFLRFDDKEPERGVVIKWEAAFLLALTMHAIWKHFSSLSEEGKKLLMDHYIYLAIVAGVPVRTYLKDYVFLGGARLAERENYVYAALLQNKEEVPASTDCAQWKKMPEILKNYTTRLGDESSSGFKQEEFLQEFYQGQKNRDAFRGWLRELLNVATNLGV